MSEDIYRPLIKDHYAHPRNWGHLEAPDIVADADNPSCGDQVHLELRLDAEGRVAEVAFEGEGCMISMASASILTEAVTGKTLSELAALTEEEMLATLDAPVGGTNRRRCALLPWQTLQVALTSYAPAHTDESAVWAQVDELNPGTPRRAE